MENRLQAIQNLIKIPVFQILGIEFTKIVTRPSTELINQSFVYQFQNRYRQIDVIYYPEKDQNDIFLVNIINRYNSHTFSLDDWLKRYDMLHKPSKFKLGNYSGDYMEKMQQFCAYVNSVLSHKTLSTILSGEIWEDVPFDWGNMR